MLPIKHVQAASGFTALLLVGLVGCTNLDVTNPNAADAGRALSTPGDVEALVAGAFNRWTNVGSYYGPTMFLSNDAGEHVAPWANAAMEQYARIPRVPTENTAGAANIGNLTWAWYEAYGAIAAVHDGLLTIADSGDNFLGANRTHRAQAYGKFMQGLAHATIAALYDSGYVYDETKDPTTVKLQGYQDVMAAALGYFADAEAIAGSDTFTVPAAWMTQDVSNVTLAQLAHSMAARFRAAVARTPTERQAVDWNAVVADVNAGLTADWEITQDCNTNYFCYRNNDALQYRLFDGWQMQNNWVAGMADTSGNYQAWVSTALASKAAFLIRTPDTRWPSGDDETTQLANPGEYYAVNNGGTRIWKHPERGTWRWSYYEQQNEPYYTAGNTGDMTTPLITVEEMNALKAEASFYANDMAAVATFVNSTRTLHGLNTTDAAGTNTSCVPRLPDGSCGDLWEMFKWEKRLETQFAGPLRIGWYFDGRGWGDLLIGTMLQIPVPYGEMLLIQESPYDFGGVGGSSAAPASVYDFCGSGGCQ